MKKVLCETNRQEIRRDGKVIKRYQWHLTPGKVYEILDEGFDRSDGTRIIRVENDKGVPFYYEAFLFKLIDTASYKDPDTCADTENRSQSFVQNFITTLVNKWKWLMP